MYDRKPDFDERDQRILEQREAALNAREGPRVGDFVEFRDGVVRRISHHWGDQVQTSHPAASYYLGKGHVSFSGSLFVSVSVETLTDTGRQQRGSVWFFHHDHATGNGGVYCEMLFRVFSCSVDAPTH